jgi:hypothetical protein
VVEYIEKIYEQRFNEQVAAYQLSQQLEIIRKNNELIAAKLVELEEDADEDEGGSPGGWVAGVERLLDNDKFMGLVQLGFMALQGKKIEGV